MEWFVWLAPVPVTSIPAASAPDALQFQAGTHLFSILALVAACTPLVLALRHRLRRPEVSAEVPRLRVLDGGKELRRRAA